MRLRCSKLVAALVAVSVVGVPVRVAEASTPPAPSAPQPEIGQPRYPAAQQAESPPAFQANAGGLERTIRNLIHGQSSATTPAPRLIEPAVVAHTGITTWNGRIEQSSVGAWYATVVETSAGTKILRSDGGVAWSDIGVPAGGPGPAGSFAIAMQSDGTVLLVRALQVVAGYSYRIDVWAYESLGWVLRGSSPACIGGSLSGAPIVHDAAIDGTQLAVIASPASCVWVSTNGGGALSLVGTASGVPNTTPSLTVNNGFVNVVWASCSGNAFIHPDRVAAGGYTRIDISNASFAPPATGGPQMGCMAPTFLQTDASVPSAGGGTVLAVSSYLYFNEYRAPLTVSRDGSGTGLAWSPLLYNDAPPTALGPTATNYLGPRVGIETNGDLAYGWFEQGASSLFVRKVARDIEYLSNVQPTPAYGNVVEYQYDLPAGGRVELAPRQYASQTHPIDGLALRSGMLYVLKGSYEPRLVDQPVGFDPNASPAVTSVTDISTSADGSFTVAATPTDVILATREGGSARLGLPDLMPVDEVVVLDGGVVVAHRFASMGYCSGATYQYVYTDRWYGPQFVDKCAKGPLEAESVTVNGQPTVALIISAGYSTSSSSRLLQSFNLGATWEQNFATSNSTPAVGGASVQTVIDEHYMLQYSAPIWYFGIARWNLDTRQLTPLVMPAGVDFSDKQVALLPLPNGLGDLVLAAFKGSQMWLWSSTDYGTSWTVLDAATPFPGTANTALGISPSGQLTAISSATCSNRHFVSRFTRALTSGAAWSSGETLWSGVGGSAELQKIDVREDGAVDEDQLALVYGDGGRWMYAHQPGLQGAFGPNAYASINGGVNVGTQSFTWTVDDVSIATAGLPLSLSRTYNSNDPRTGLFGRGWSSSLDINAVINCNTQGVTVLYPDGRRESFGVNGAGGYLTPAGYTSVLTATPTTLRLTQRNGTVHEFNKLSGELLAIEDAAGRRQVVSYNSFGRPEAITDQASGRSLSFVYSGPYITEVRTTAVTSGGSTAPLTWRFVYVGNTLSKSCDARGSDPVTGFCALYTTSGGRLVSVQNARGDMVVTVQYRADGTVAWQENGEGDRTTFDRAAVRVGRSVDELGGETLTTVDNQGRPLSVVGPDGNTTTYTYDSRGYLVSFTRPDGAVRYRSYSANGDLLIDTNGEGQSIYRTFDAAGNELSLSDERSANALDPTYRVTTTYNTKRQPVSSSSPPTAQFPAGLTEYWTYTSGTEPATGGGLQPPGLLKSHVAFDSTTTTYTYDSAGNLRREQQPTGLVIEYTYDQLGRRLTRREISDSYPLGVVTEYQYDALSRLVVETGPAVTNVVDGRVHRLRTTTTYDAAGNVVSQLQEDIGGSDLPDPPRQVTTVYDDAGRETSTSVLGGGTRTSTYDSAGNLVTEVDERGTVFSATYNGRGLPVSYTLNANPAAGFPSDVVLWTRTYDSAGRLSTEVDANGKITTLTYDRADRLRTRTLTNFANPDGSIRPLVIEERFYDASGRIVELRSGGGIRRETYTYDQSGRLVSTTLDPGGLDRVTSWRYDAGGRTLAETVTQGGVTEEVRFGYNAAGLNTSKVVENGAVDLETTMGYDTRGLVVSEVDARGNAPAANPSLFTTHYTSDELGRVVRVTLAPATSYADGVSASSAASETASGYNTYGDLTHQRDGRGNVVRTTFDQRGQPTSTTYPQYTTSTGVTLTPVESVTRDPVGNVISATDRRGQTTDLTYDRQNRLVKLEAPAVDGLRPTTTYTFDAAGNLLAQTDPIGAQTTYGYDALDRRTRTTQIVRVPGGGLPLTLTTVATFDDLGREIATTTPLGATTSRTYNAANEVLSETDASGAVSTFTFDLRGRSLSALDPLGRGEVHTYDLAGRRITTSTRGASGAVLGTSAFAYDEVGNRVSETSPLGTATSTVGDYQTTFEFDARNRLVGVVERVSPTASVSTSYRYDLAGNATGAIDGRGNLVTYGFNSWNLQTLLTEPATAAYPALSDRTWVTDYDAGGLPAREQQPGAVVVVRTFDALGRLTLESGTQGATTVTRDPGYDLAGRMLTVNAGASTVGFTYDDRGLLTASTGAGFAATYAFDGDGRLVTQTDAAGTATFTWTPRGDLASMVDPVSGVTLSHSYNPAGDIVQTLWSGGAKRVRSYDDFGRLVEDKSLNSGGSTTLRLQYTFDADSRLVGKVVTAAGNGAQGSQSFGYDEADRLVSWVSAAGVTTSFGWDASGNLVSKDAVTSSFDARNRLLSSSDGRVNTFTARGTLATSKVGSTTTSWTFDPLGRLSKRGSVVRSYDGLDRLLTIGSSTFSYGGLGTDPVAAGTQRLSRDPAGNAVGAWLGTAGRLLMSDRHGDVVGVLSGTGGLTGSKVYDPFGVAVGVKGTQPVLGFQGDVTDSVSGDVWMGSRWYRPTFAGFVSRDTVAGVAAVPGTLNRFGYGLSSPLLWVDPDGRTAREVESGGGEVLLPPSTGVVEVVSQPPSGWGAQLKSFAVGFRDGLLSLPKLVGGAVADIWSCSTGGPRGCFDTVKSAAREFAWAVTHPVEVFEACLGNVAGCAGQILGGSVAGGAVAGVSRGLWKASLNRVPSGAKQPELSGAPPGRGLSPNRNPATNTADDLLARANAARDVKVAELSAGSAAARKESATVVGAYNVRTGNVAAGTSSKVLQECAEACAARLVGGDIADIRFTQSLRPRGPGKPPSVVPVCAGFCEPTYGRGAFPDPATIFESDLG